jgi:hypothetical protein
MSKRCPQCQTDNRDEANRCISCNYVFAEVSKGMRMCPAGRHVMDPGWSDCPYCGGSQGLTTNPAGPTPHTSGRTPTVAENPSRRGPTVGEQEPLPRMPPPPAPPAQRKGGPSRRKTVFGETPEDEMATTRLRPPGADRRIVAILVTYTWRPDGEIYSVREGRNYIGNDPDCEVCVTQDPQLSSRHATILYRGRGAQFIIDDEKSMNGTFVNGQSVDMKRSLGNYDKINTGATAWTFIILEPGTAE